MDDKQKALLQLVSAALKRSDAGVRVEVLHGEVCLVATQRTEHRWPDKTIVLEPGDALILQPTN